MESTATRRERPEDMDAVQVCVRIRPLSSKEKHEQTKSCIRIASSSPMDALANASVLQRPPSATTSTNGPQQIIVGKDRAFTFDNVLGVNSSQQDTYEQCVAPLVRGFVEGYNATILAYGQTGTGKTHTMSGAGYDAKGDKKNNESVQGIIPRTIKAIFQYMDANQQRTEFSLRVEYIEIYNEELRDLLHPDTPSKQLTIREDGDGNIVLAGVKSEVAATRDAVFRYLVLGGASRATGSTLMNEQSSRSHAIFSLLLHQRDVTSGQSCNAKFHLVDLAGSERAKRTGAVAGRFKESVAINQGLLALGNVISALGDEKRRQGTTSTTTGNGGVHVPYRDSKLTRLLCDSLGGNSKTLMIACVSPATINFEETLNTLKYANRAKNIRNRPIVNQQVETDDEIEIARMRQQIASLQTKLQQTHIATATSRPSTSARSSKSRPSSSASTSSSSAAPTTIASSSASSAALIASTTRISTLEQQLKAATSTLELTHETVEQLRTLSLEAITTLIAMEREIKPLGRSVQQQLNEVVKRLNAAIQAANACIAHRKADDSSRNTNRPEHDDDDGDDANSSNASSRPSTAPVNAAGGASNSDVRLKRMTKELESAKHDLVKDEQIFAMKNAEIERLQALLRDANSRNDKLLDQVQQLERGGQLWSNVDAHDDNTAAGRIRTESGTGVNASELLRRSLLSPSSAIAKHTEAKGPDSSDESERVSTARTATATSSSINGRRTAKPPASRGLFTKRGNTAAFDGGEEDNVLIGTGDDDDKSRSTKTRGAVASRSGIPTPSTGASSNSSRRADAKSSTAATHTMRLELTSGNNQSDGLATLERTITSLRAKIEELQQQNSELLHSREESTRRWQLDRQHYERQVSDAEQTIDGLRSAKQALEDTLLDDKHSTTATSIVVTTADSDAKRSSSSVRRSQRMMPLVLELDERDDDSDTKQQQPEASADAKQHRSSRSSLGSTAKSTHTSTKHLPSKSLTIVLDECVTQLLAINSAREHVLGILREKRDAEQSKNDATQRVSALEMQSLRQSLTVRASIADVAQSIQLLTSKLQAESRSVDEIARLTKLKSRAERKLQSLQTQAERGDELLLDSDAQHERADLVELIDDLASHIAFQDAELATARADLQLLQTRTATQTPAVAAGGDTEDEAVMAAASPVETLAQALVERLIATQKTTRVSNSNASDSEADVTAFVTRVLGEIARLRSRERELLDAATELESVITDRNTTLQQLETGLAAARTEFDRRLVLERQEHAIVINELQQQLNGLRQAARDSSSKLQQQQQVEVDSDGNRRSDDEWKHLIVSSQKKDAYIADLEKHVVFYKAKAKQMQAQLTQLIRASSSDAATSNQNDRDSDHSGDEGSSDGGSDGTEGGRRQRQRNDRASKDTDSAQQRLQQRINQLEAANDTLMRDLATAKVYLRSSASKAPRMSSSGDSAPAGTHVVRISRSELRELPATGSSRVLRESSSSSNTRDGG